MMVRATFHHPSRHGKLFMYLLIELNFTVEVFLGDATKVFDLLGVVCL